MAKGKIYTGELATPIPPTPRPPITVDPIEWVNAEVKRLREARAAKLDLLCRHFGIDPAQSGAAGQLLHALIDAHVPGFKIGTRRSRGQPKKWTVSRSLALIANVRTAMERDELTQAQALRRVEREMGESSLYQRLDEAYDMPFIITLMELGMSDAPAAAWKLAAEAFADTPELDHFGT